MAHPSLIWQSLWRAAVKKGDVYLGTYVGWYNVREETFVTETEAAASDFLDPVSRTRLPYPYPSHGR
eukprot:4413166-Prymnesium_polylepis.1